MKSGQLMRQVVNKINEVDFNNLAERQHFGDIYEQVLKHLASTIHCVDDEIIGSLQRREQRRRARAAMPHSNPGGD